MEARMQTANDGWVQAADSNYDWRKVYPNGDEGLVSVTPRIQGTITIEQVVWFEYTNGAHWAIHVGQLSAVEPEYGMKIVDDLSKMYNEEDAND